MNWITKRAIKAASLGGSGRILGNALGLLITSSLAHNVTDIALSTYFLAITYASIISIIIQLGTPEILARFAGEKVNRGNETSALQIGATIVLTSAGFISILALSTYILLSLLNTLFSLPSVIYVYTVFWGLALASLNNNCEFFRTFHFHKRFAIHLYVSQNIFFLSLITIIRLNGNTLGPEGILACGISSTLLALLLSSIEIATITKSSGFKLRILSKKEINKYLKFGIPNSLNNLTNAIISNIDLIIMGALSSPSQTAAYGIATRLVRLAGIPIVMAAVSLPSTMSNLLFRDKKNYLQLLIKQTSSILLTISSSLFLGIAAFGKPLILFLFGEGFDPAYLYFLILFTGKILSIYIGPASYLLTIAGLGQTMLKLNIIFSITLIAAGAAVTSFVGGAGMAIAVAVIGTWQYYAFYRLAQKKIGISTNASCSIALRLAKRLINIRAGKSYKCS
ncbi:lipopolysaccharide biosynthesis protein [Thalassospira lucentensis]|uniref:lipopolysaccharide biosynthesis protein n=1 Tax=Thalassospira lucentensis TaxID=168935 RepID=UPI0029434671|nr:oligosaccharide flippase family protein [Thalassospira lucentensis]WOI11246.1 oligosaccharide flippase family protein [Thalassospira lucentensis]